MYKEEKVDVVHVHCDQDAVAPALAAHLAGVPVVVMSWHLPFPFKGRGGRLLTILYNRIFAVSHSVRNTQLEGGAPPHKIEVVHHGTDVEGFQMLTVGPVQIRAELNLAPDHVAVGIVGRISPEKGHRHLLAALRLIKDRYSHLRVVIIGAGPDEALLRAEAAADHLDEQVIFAGFRDPVNNAINAMDIVVAPSTWQEPCSAAVQQAMILAKPVIGTRVGGTPEMIADGETGLLVAPGDPGALADAIGRLADEPEARRAMGQAGRRRAEREFSLQGMADKIEQFYLQMYDARSGGVRQPDALAH
jgi:glycosyltransferase involved in cell wall biosynthesis